MWYFALVFALWLLLLAFSVIGSAVAQLLPPRLRAFGSYYFAPILGMGVLIPVLSLHGWYFPFHSSSSRILLLIVLVLSVIGLIRSGRPLAKKAFLRPAGMLLLFAILVSAPMGYQILRFGVYRAFDDTFTYLIHGQWLQRHAFNEPVGSTLYSPGLFNVTLYQGTAMRMGGSFLLAWIQSLFGLRWSYYAYPLAVNLALSCGSLAVAGSTALIIRRGRLAALTAGLFAGVGLNGFAFGAYSGFMPQTFGLAFAVAQSGLLAGMIMELSRASALRRGRLFWSAIPVSVLLVGVAFTYHEILVVVLSGDALALLVAGWLRLVSPRKLAALTVYGIVQTALLGNVEWLHAVTNLIIAAQRLGSPYGWPVNWSVLEFLGFALSMKAPHAHLWLVSRWVGPALTVLALIGAAYTTATISRNKSRAAAFYPHASVLFVLIGLFLKLRHLGPFNYSTAVGTTFVQFKTCSWAAPFCAVLFGASVILVGANVRRRLGSRRFVSAPLFVCALLAVTGLVINARVSAKIPLGTNRVLADYRNPFPTLLPIRKILKDVPKTNPIYLDLGSNDFNTMSWIVSYLLYDRPVLAVSSGEAAKLSKRSAVFDPGSVVISSASADASDPPPSRAGNLIVRTPREPAAIRIPESFYGDLEHAGEDFWYWSAEARFARFRYRIIGAAKAAKLRFRWIPATSDSLVAYAKTGDEPSARLTLRSQPGDNRYELPLSSMRGPVQSDLSLDFSPLIESAGPLPDIQDLEVDLVSTRPDSPQTEKHAGKGPVLPKLAFIEGLSYSERWGRWSEGNHVAFHFKGVLPAEFTLLITACASPSNEGLPIAVAAGDAERTVTLQSSPTTQSLYFTPRTTTNRITFFVPHPKSTKELGIGTDTRKIGIGFASMEIHAGPGQTALPRE